MCVYYRNASTKLDIRRFALALKIKPAWSEATCLSDITLPFVSCLGHIQNVTAALNLFLKEEYINLEFLEQGHVWFSTYEQGKGKTVPFLTLGEFPLRSPLDTRVCNFILHTF